MEEARKRKLQDKRRNSVPKGIGLVVKELVLKFLVIGDFGVGEWIFCFGDEQTRNLDLVHLIRRGHRAEMLVRSDNRHVFVYCQILLGQISVLQLLVLCTVLRYWKEKYLFNEFFKLIYLSRWMGIL